MTEQWTPRGIKGAKCLAAGIFLSFTTQQALAAVSSSLGRAVVALVFGVVGPILMIVGLYFLGTRHKQPKKPDVMP
ncbi:MAG: hypothetical protein RLZZ618_281 [Pseudomonadota bacterium]|jgi:uncharacterized membrane protein YfbV (UPF0208 family)